VLRVLLGNPQEDVTYFNLQKYLKHHYIMNPDAVPATPKKTKKTVEPVAVEPAPVAVQVIAEPEKKKKIIIKKKKTELTEEV
jgi:hypothetical protein